MNFLKKTVTLRIHIFVLLLALLFLGMVAVGIYFRLPQNLFFMLLQPSQVESVQIRVGSQEYQELSAQEIAELVGVLKDFRIRDRGVRSCPPDSQASAEYHIHMKWGVTMHLSCSDGAVTINADRYQAHADVIDRLYALYRQQRKARSSQ